jgi:hypothetical protein
MHIQMAGITLCFFQMKLVFLFYGRSLVARVAGLYPVAAFQGKRCILVVKIGQLQALPAQRAMTVTTSISGHLQTLLLLSSNDRK